MQGQSEWGSSFVWLKIAGDKWFFTNRRIREFALGKRGDTPEIISASSFSISEASYYFHFPFQVHLELSSSILCASEFEMVYPHISSFMHLFFRPGMSGFK